MTTSFYVPKKLKIGSEELFVHHWNVFGKPASPTASPTSSDEATKAASRAVVVIYHGFLAHGLYPTVRYAAELLSAAGYQVIAADYPGHGQSPGTRGYLKSTEEVVELGFDIAQYAKKYGDQIFFVGSSMGGTIALAVAHEMMRAGEEVAGVVLLAPMLKLSVSSWEQSLLSVATVFVPKLQIIPSSSTSADNQCRDPVKRKACETDPYVIPGQSIRVGSAATCVDLTEKLHVLFPRIRVPFLVLLADEDVVVDKQGALDFYEQAASTDKTLNRYKALHAMLCEPSPLVDRIQRDMITWIRARTGKV